MQLLAGNIQNHKEPAEVEAHLEELAKQVETLLAPLRGPLATTRFPYSHAQGQVSLWASVFPAELTGGPASRLVQEAHQLWDHFTALYVRVVGELFQLAGLRHGMVAGANQWR